MKTFVTVDLDSTLCDTTHRHSMIDRVNGTDWGAYSRACVNDGPIMATVALIKLLHDCGVLIVYLTGRDESARPYTMEWFDKNELPCAGLYMDTNTAVPNYSHAEYKLRRMQEILNDPQWVNEDHRFHIDDWPDVKYVFEEAGIPCLCVRTPEEVAAFMVEKQEGPR